MGNSDIFSHRLVAATNRLVHSWNGAGLPLGSMMLIPYTLSAWMEISDDQWFFFGSLLLAILIMVFRYHTEVTRLNLSLSWWYFWLFCLTLAVGLQMTIVFHLL